MFLLESSCLLIVAIYLAVRACYEPRRGRLFRRLALVLVASWTAEDSVIHAYHFYQYSPRWSVFIDAVPLMIILIWPIVITSAWDLMNALAGRTGGRRVLLAAAAMVFIDAFVMEPIAVQSGLWSWNEPGLFGVPPIGVLGWAYFAVACLAIFDWVDRHRRSPWLELLVLVVPIAVTHVALLATWWGALRWINHPINPWIAVALAWLLHATLAVVAARHPAALRPFRRDLLLRVPAAAFFFVLLGLHARGNPALIAYAIALAPPYLVLTWRARGAGPRISRRW
jgi:hypothetical protein